MRKLLLGIGAAIVAITMTTHSQSLETLSLADNEMPTRWLVELSSPPRIDGTESDTLDREEAAFDAAAARAGIRYSKSHRFSDLWNGIALTATGGNVSKLRALPGVRAVFPDVKVSIAQQEDPATSVIELTTALKMTGADLAQSELGLSGRGVKVAVIDTGVDYDHPDLGGCFGPGCRVQNGYDLVGDDFNSSNPASVIAPDPFPDDCNGHGTHVAGIIGASGGITGVAPQATFLAYRVFGCVGTTSSEIMLDAMERARRDGADVVNMSIGAAFQWPQYPTATAADRLVKHGVVVVASAGNDGALGLYGVSAPSVGKNVIGVASFDNTHASMPAFVVSGGGADITVGYIAATGAPAPPTTGTFPMARTGTTTTANDACGGLSAGSLTGQVVLIRRGTCSFNQKAFNAQNAGAVGVVLYNNVEAFLSATVAGPPTITIPVVGVTASRGAQIDAKIATGTPVALTWTNLLVKEPNPTGNLISSFSSYGAAPDLSFKPDLGAPGGSVRSTLPLEAGGYGNLSGTSMSSPHVAGAVALLLEARPHLKPEQVQERLQNTARPHLWFGNPSLGFLDNVHRQGAGMIEIDDAVTAGAVISPSSLALGEIESGSVARSLRLKLAKPLEKGGHDEDVVTYTLGYQPALSTGSNTFTPSFFSNAATVTFAAPTVAIGGEDDEAVVEVTITPPPKAAPPADYARLFGGYITFTPDDGGQVLRVPFTGYNGDYQAIQVLTSAGAGLPVLAKLTATGFVPQPSGATFTMVGNDVPFVLVHLNHQVANLTVEIFDVTTGSSQHFAEDADFIGRNSTATSFFAVPWDGTTFKKLGHKIRTLPNGTYRAELSILKALGDPKNPAHHEVWVSPNITIARP